MKSSNSSKAALVGDNEEICGAFDSDTGYLVLVVEAGSEIEALVRVDCVAPLLKVTGDCELIVAKMDKIPDGVATFFRGFVEVEKIGFSRDNVTPGTSTHQ